MRYSLKLCKDEIDFRENRKPFLFQAMRKLLGPRGPKSMDEVSLFFYFFRVISFSQTPLEVRLGQAFGVFK